MRKNLIRICVLFAFFVCVKPIFAESVFEHEVLPFAEENLDYSEYFDFNSGDVLPFAEEKIYGFIKNGYGTYYGSSNLFQGRKTASGEIFDRNLMTCAMNNIKLGTYLRVTNLANNKSIVVKANDRMGTSHGNSIDLSMKAFEKIAELRTGKIWVKIEEEK